MKNNITIGEIVDQISTMIVDKTSDKLSLRDSKKLNIEDLREAFEESRLTHPMLGFKHQTFEEYYNEKYKI